MPSILSRLRTHAVSQSSRHSVQSAPTTATTVTAPTPNQQAIEEQPTGIHEPPTQESALLTRKIYPDLNLLPDEIAAESTTTIRRGLPPPVRRGLSISSNLPTPATRPGPAQQPNVSSGHSTKGDPDSPKPSQSSSSSDNTPPGGGDGRGFIGRLGDWSTFGRRRAPPPSLNEFGRQLSPSPSAWRKKRHANSRRSSRPSSKTTSTHSSPHENKENTPRISLQSSLGRRTPAARSSSYRQVSTSVARELGFDSPPTLGQPSPEVIVSRVPPSLPPLHHPTLHSRARTATFPPRARTAGHKNNSIAPDQFTFGRSLRAYRSLPRVQHIFRTRSNKGGDEGNDEQEGEGDELAGDAAGDKGRVPVPTIASGSRKQPINVSPTTALPTSSSSSSSLSPPPASVGPIDAYDPTAPNLYDPIISLSGNVVRMQQDDTSRVPDKKPLRSSLKASARSSPTPIASTSSSNASGSAALMPSFSLVAAVASGAPESIPPKTPVSSPGRSETAKGKRKAEDVDITPPDSKKATFAVPAPPRDQPAFLAPSSYRNSKRARLSAPSPSPPNTNAHNTGTYSSRASSRARAPSSTRSGTGAGPPDNASERERRRSLSQRSIPISALVTPQVPSIGRASSAYHMRDPRRPPRRMATGWALRLRTADEAGSPVHAWLFYPALVLFPLWWVGAVWRVPPTRTVGGTDTEKAVPLDDPQIEFDARSWRFRCRVMAVISLFTYVPFIICLAIFA